MSLCKSPFRGPVCNSNSGTIKLVINQTNTHLPFAFQPYHLLTLCYNSLFCAGTFIAKSDHPAGTHSNLTFPGSLSGPAYPHLSHNPVLSSQHALLSIRGITISGIFLGSRFSLRHVSTSPRPQHNVVD